MSENTALQAIANKLRNDATFSGLMTGGIYDEITNEVDEIGRQTTPNAFNANGELLPCCLVKTETITNLDALDTSARMFVLVIVYQQYGKATMRSAVNRAYNVLHRQCVTSGGVWDCRHADDIPSEDPNLNAYMVMSRYATTLNRASA